MWLDCSKLRLHSLYYFNLRGRGRWMKFFAFPLVFVIIMKAGVAEAGPEEDCLQIENGDLRIQGCTQVIERDEFNFEDKAWAFVNRGAAHKAQGDFTRAIADYDEAIRLDPQIADAFNNRGNSHQDQGDLAVAIADYDQAIRLNPKFALAFNNRGFAHRVRGDLARAVADLDEAIRLEPQFALAYYNRGLAQLTLGNIGRAIADYDEAIRLDPQYVDGFYERRHTLHAVPQYMDTFQSRGDTLEAQRCNRDCGR